MIDRRLLIPLVAGLMIASLCAWRIVTNRPQTYEDQVAAAVILRPAPSFEARDVDNHLLRLAAFLGRHKIIVLFFDGEVGAAKDPDLLRLRERFSELQAHDVKVVAISAALPQTNRLAMKEVGKYPFPLVSDLDPLNPGDVLRIHRQWGRFDTKSNKPLTGIFYIDRKGQVLYTPEGPKPMGSVDEAIGKVTSD